MILSKFRLIVLLLLLLSLLVLLLLLFCLLIVHVHLLQYIFRYLKNDIIFLGLSQSNILSINRILQYPFI